MIALAFIDAFTKINSTTIQKISNILNGNCINLSENHLRVEEFKKSNSYKQRSGQKVNTLIKWTLPVLMLTLNRRN